MAVADVDVVDVVAEAEVLELELVLFMEEVDEGEVVVTEEVDAVVEAVDAVVEDVATLHWPFWQL